jgi:hypothetical protein
MRIFVSGLLLSVILLCLPSNSAAQNVCWDGTVAGQMVMALEKRNICEQQLVVKDEAEAELKKQIAIKGDTIKLMEEQVVIYKNIIDMQKKMDETKDKLHAKELEAAKPTFMDNLGKIAIGIGIGIVITVGVALAL